MTDAIVRLATDADLRRDRSERGLERARSFSWAQTATEMLAVYHRAAGVTAKSPSPAPVERRRSARAGEVDVEEPAVMTTARLAFDRLAPAYDALAAGEAFRLQRQQTHRLLSRSGFGRASASSRSAAAPAPTRSFSRGSAPASSRAIRRRRC